MNSSYHQNKETVGLFSEFNHHFLGQESIKSESATLLINFSFINEKIDNFEKFSTFRMLHKTVSEISENNQSDAFYEIDELQFSVVVNNKFWKINAEKLIKKLKN